MEKKLTAVETMIIMVTSLYFNIIYSTTMSVRNTVHKQPGFNMSGKSKFVRHVSGNRDMD